jgi:hypothetical protein
MMAQVDALFSCSWLLCVIAIDLYKDKSKVVQWAYWGPQYEEQKSTAFSKQDKDQACDGSTDWSQ